MNESWSRTLLFIEASLIAAPLTLFLLISIPFSITGASEPWSIEKFLSVWPDIAVSAIAVFAAICTLAGWWLLIVYLAGGVSSLRAQHRAWWIIAGGGGVLVLVALMNVLLPAASELSALSVFRQHLDFLLAGAPLLVPLIHLWAEACY